MVGHEVRFIEDENGSFRLGTLPIKWIDDLKKKWYHLNSSRP